jgi:hypothetical protein
VSAAWRVTFDRSTAFVVGPKAEARRRIAACGDHSPMWVARRSAWATSPAVASRVLDQLEARRVTVTVEHADQVELDLTKIAESGLDDLALPDGARATLGGFQIGGRQARAAAASGGDALVSARNYSARVMRFRAGVYAARGRITPGCQVLLLRLSDSMDSRGIVSVPRSRLADEFDCPPVRITEWVNQAFAAGFLDRVRRGRPGVTAVYQGLVVGPEVREGVPSQRYATTNQVEVRDGVPQNEVQRYARAVPQEVVGSVTAAIGPACDEAAKEKAS